MQQDGEIPTLKLERLGARVWLLTAQVTGGDEEGLGPSAADSQCGVLDPTWQPTQVLARMAPRSQYFHLHSKSFNLCSLLFNLTIVSPSGRLQGYSSFPFSGFHCHHR